MAARKRLRRKRRSPHAGAVVDQEPCSQATIDLALEVYSQAVDQAIRTWFADHGLQADASPKLDPTAAVDQIAAAVEAGVVANRNKIPGISSAKKAGGQSTLDSYRQRNVALIKTVGPAAKKALDRVLRDNRGLHVDALTAKLQAAAGVERWRARLWARDQTLKLHATLSEIENRSIGIEEYVWRTVQDGNVRQGHSVLNKRTFRYDDPPETGTGKHNPGQDYQCRCFGSPVLPEIAPPKPKTPRKPKPPAVKPKAPKKPRPRTPEAQAAKVQAKKRQPAEFEAEFQHYGRAAKALSYGKAALENGLDRPAQEVVAWLARAELAPGQKEFFQQILTVSLTGTPTLRAIAAQATSRSERVMIEALAALHEHATTAQTGPLQFSGSRSVLLSEHVAPAQRWWAQFCTAHTTEAHCQYSEDRSWYNHRDRELRYRDTSNLIHEIWHEVEASGGRSPAAQDWRDVRTQGEELQRIADLLPDDGYTGYERTRPDKFFHVYVGKPYSEEASEILTTGVQEMYNRPGRLYREDPEHFFLTLGHMAGYW